MYNYITQLLYDKIFDDIIGFNKNDKYHKYFLVF